LSFIAQAVDPLLKRTFRDFGTYCLDPVITGNPAPPC
jgi:hypothetical protein